jgi:putative ABC transport system permease protein
MDSLIQDLRYAIRTLLRSPGFTLVAVLTLALGIGANTAIFSVLYAVLLRPLPYPEPGRLAGLAQVYRGSRSEQPVDWREYRFLDENSKVFEALAVSTNLGFNVFTGQEADRARGMRVSSDFFRVLSVSPLLGRAFSADEDQPGGPQVAILSYGYWQRRFGGDRSIVGRAVALDGAPYTVVGVMPSGFQTQPEADVWSTVAQVSRTVGSGTNLRLIARLKPGLSFGRARTEYAPTLAAFRESFRGRLPHEVTFELYPQRRMIVSDLRTPLQVLFGAIGFVLLIACANVAGLLLGRATGRGRELALRVALGASRARLMRQLLTESVLLSLVGGAVALLLARWGLQLLLTFVPPEIKAAGIRLDWWAVAFTFAVALVTGVAFGLLPAWHASRPDLQEALKEGSGRTTATAGHGRLRDVLAAGEVALSLVLLVGAGLLIRTVGNLLHTDPGFDPRHVLSAEIWLNGTGYDSSGAIADFYRRLTGQVALLPGVRSAAVVEAGLPLERGGNQYVMIEGRAEGASVDYRTITPEYFRTLGIRLTQGRAFTSGDVQGADPVAVVNETFARRYLAGRGAVGRTVSFEGGTRPPRRIVGVVGDVRSFIGSPPMPTVFLPSAQTPAGYTRMFGSWFPIHVVVSVAGDPGSLVTGLTRAIHDTDPRVPVGRVRPLEVVLSSTVANSRFQMLLLAVFAGLALVLAAVGIYGVMSYLVAQRRHEIGVRLALGAVPLDVLGMVLRRGLLLALAGAGAGLVGAVGLTRLLRSWLYEVSPLDIPTFTAVTALLLLVALAACWIPARRATKVDPVGALRSE